MEHLPEFILNHWLLCGLLALLILTWFALERFSRSKAYSSQELTQLVNHGEGVLIDIRNADDFAQGHIAQSVNFPFSELNERLPQLARYGHRPLIVICLSGTTSELAIPLLKQAGHTHIGKLYGGLQRWRQDGLPLVHD